MRDKDLNNTVHLSNFRHFCCT